MQRFAINQFHYSLTNGDAVSNHLFLIQEALRKIGVGGSVYASEIKHLPAGKALRFKKSAIWNCDLIFLHHSHGNPILKDILQIEIPKALIYHNITPASFYRHDPVISELSKLGRKQLKEIRNAVTVAFADSEYNAQELKEMGYKDVRLLPLLDLSHVHPVKESHSVSEKSKNILFVGRLAPHKNQKLLIEMFFYLKDLLPPNSKLILVGSGDPIYTQYLKLLTRKLGLTKTIVFAGKVTDRELEEIYRSSDAFVCASLHEGFCIPVIEAMKHQIPVFYLPEAAVPETMGDAGIQFQSREPYSMAKSLSVLLEEKQFTDAVLQSQLAHLEKLKRTQNMERIQIQVQELLNLMSASPKDLKKLRELET